MRSGTRCNRVMAQTRQRQQNKAGARKRPGSLFPCFAVGAAMPLFITALAPGASLIIFVVGTSLLFLALLGALAARAGGASVIPSIIRVTLWGALAMGITAGVGVLFGTVV